MLGVRKKDAGGQGDVDVGRTEVWLCLVRVQMSRRRRASRIAVCHEGGFGPLSKVTRGGPHRRSTPTLHVTRIEHIPFLHP